MATVALPVVNRGAMDNSIVSTVARCPRLGYYQYWLNRAPEGKSYPLLNGLAYHKYREVLEKLYLENFPTGLGTPSEYEGLAFHNIAVTEATKDWEDPPIGHKYEWMTYNRVIATLEAGFKQWLREKREGRIRVLFTEQSFELMLPNGEIYGGRIDQIIEWNSGLWVRDFKTTSRMGKTFADKFDPNNQFTGYTWGAAELSGRKVEGAVVEVPYNTSKQGPEIHQFLSTRSPGNIEQWLASIQAEFTFIRLMEGATDELGMLAWPMRTTACEDFGGCFFRGACRQDNEGSIVRWLLGNTIESHWDFNNPDAEAGLPE